ncbi:hypothetical protein BFS10_00060 [Brucella suis]|nr:hypothetical protein BFS10_00060 [Brucella suis]
MNIFGQCAENESKITYEVIIKLLDFIIYSIIQVIIVFLRRIQAEIFKTIYFIILFFRAFPEKVRSTYVEKPVQWTDFWSRFDASDNT